MKVFFILIILVGISFSQEKINIDRVKVTDNIYMLKGYGGNIAVSIGTDGVFMIDDQFARVSDKIKSRIKEVSDKPIKFIINTHWHGDHTGGNKVLAEEGAIIVAHENVRKRMSEEQFNDLWQRKTPASPEEALPVITFSREISFHLNGDDIEVVHLKTAHTDGDAVIFFKNQNILHTGDLYFAKKFPFIDTSSGGSVTGLIDAIETLLKIVDDKTKIIPGHGELSNKKELEAYLSMIKKVSGRVEKAIKDGKSLDEIQKMNLTREFDSEYNWSFINSKTMVLIVYNSLKK